MNFKEKTPPPQPTESEAIVAAQRAPQTPQTPLVPPVPLPVDKAAALPVAAEIDPGALPTPGLAKAEAK